MFVQTIARILADTLKLRVTYSHTAGTFSIGKEPDGTLQLTMSNQMLAITHESEERIGTLVRGSLAHEALGHGYHTDFSATAAAKNGAYAASLANAFEDVRIEALAPRRFIGARRILADMARVVDQRGLWEPTEDPAKWQDNLVVALLRKFRTDILHQPLRPDVTAQAIAWARNALGDALYEQVEALAAKGCTAPDTKGASQQADAIVKLLQRQPPRQPAPSSAQSGGKQQSSDQPGGKGQPGRSNGRQASKGHGQQPAQGGAGRAIRPAFDPQSAKDVTVERAMSDACATSTAPSVNVAPLLDDTGLAAREAGTAGGTSVGVGSAWWSSSKHTVTGGNRLVGQIASRLERALRAVTEEGDDLESDTGRINLTRLPGIVAGTEWLPFIVDGDRAPGIDTELMLVLDESGSMQSLVVLFLRQLIRASLLALGRFAPDLGISFATFADSARLLIRPGQHVTPALANTVAGLYAPNRGTQWAASIAPLVPILAGSRRRRKILLTVTDGVLLYDSSLRRDVLADLDAQHIEHPFLSIRASLPAECPGIVCAAEPEAFAKAFCQTLVNTMQPEFV